MDNAPVRSGKVLLYSDGSGKEFVSVAFQEKNFWLTQAGRIS